MVKFLHLADVHLGGRLFASDDALIERLRTAQRAAFRRAVGCALQEEVDAVLIAGNLFDDRRLDYDAQRFLTGQLARLDEAGVPCFYAAGPSDPGGARAPEEQVAWPKSLHRFDAPTPQAAVLEGEDGRPLARIVGAGPSDPAAADSPAGPFPKASPEVPHVGLLHAPLMPTAEEQRPADDVVLPPSVQRAMKKAGRYDYWALGGAARQRPAASKPPGNTLTAWYAGPTAGRHPADAGPQGGLLVTLRPDAPAEVTFRSFAPLCWADLTLDGLGDAQTTHALLQRARQAFAEVRGAHERPAWLARFTLTGPCPLAPALREASARTRLEADLAEHLDLEGAFVRLRQFVPPADPDRHRGEPHVLGEALTLLARAEDDPALLRSLAPEALAAGPADPDAAEAYLRECLRSGLDAEACARLLRESP